MVGHPSRPREEAKKLSHRRRVHSCPKGWLGGCLAANWLAAFLLISFIRTSVLALAFVFLYRLYQERFLGYWAVAWSLFALRATIEYMQEVVGFVPALLAFRDVWDALRSDRPYREAWPEDKVRVYLREEAGIQFDLKLVDVFIAMLEKMPEEG